MTEYVASMILETPNMNSEGVRVLLIAKGFRKDSKVTTTSALSAGRG